MPSTLTPQVMTFDYAKKEGFVSPVDGQINEERKHPYVRITLWYAPDDAWMVRNVVETLTGCDYIVVVDETSQAVFRARGEIKNVDGEA